MFGIDIEAIAIANEVSVGLVRFCQFGIILAITLIVVGGIAGILLPLVSSIMNKPKSLIKGGIGLAALLVLYLIGYSMSSDELTQVAINENLTKGQFQAVGGALQLVIILSFIAILGVIVSITQSMIQRFL